MNDAEIARRYRAWFASIHSQLEASSGKSLEEWAAIAIACPDNTISGRSSWLSSRYGLSPALASKILSAIFRYPENAPNKEFEAFSRNEQAGVAFGVQWGGVENDAELSNVKSRFLDPYVSSDVSCLEIGSGGGRWTAFLLGAREVTCVEVEQGLLDYLEKRLGTTGKLRLVKTNGTDLPGVPAGSIDYVFSFGTFVHLWIEDIRSYIASVSEVLKVSGNVVLHVSNANNQRTRREKPSFSNTSPEQIGRVIEEYGLRVVEVDEAILTHGAMMRAVKLG